MQHKKKIAASTSEALSPSVDLLSVLLLHHSPVVRRSAAAAATACCKNSLQLGSSILAGLQGWLRNGAPDPIIADPSADDSALSPVAISQRYRRAAMTLAQAVADSQSAPSAEFYARLVQISTHPDVATGGLSFRASWKSIKRWGKLVHFQCLSLHKDGLV